MSPVLDAIMAPPATVAYPLPEGVFRDPATGNLFFNRLVFKGFYDAADTRLFTPDQVDAARRRGSEIFEDHDEVPVPCVVPPPWATVDQIEALRTQARLEDKWFWHPGLNDWLPWGRKRSREAPENRGTGAIQRTRQRRVVPSPDQTPVLPTVGPSPVMAVGPTPVVEPPSEAAVEAAPRRGRPPGRPPGMSMPSREEV